MSKRIVNTNIRLNLDNADDRRAWERLQHLDRKLYKSYTRAIVVALNDFLTVKSGWRTTRIWRRGRRKTLFFGKCWTPWSAACFPRLRREGL